MKKLYFLIFSSIVFLDAFSKQLAIKYLSNEEISVFPGCNLDLSFNSGISFSLFKDYSFMILTLIIGAIIILFGIYTLGEYVKGVNVTPEVFVLAGGFSNLLNRFTYKGVIDFIDLYVGNYHWPTFNIADVFIMLGIFFIMIRSWQDAYRAKN
ncbi:signal peptidase II [Candidatus Babeliales bacterium]|nr:signal peptidase II [Candidatus Babeliales bacterium]